MQTTSLNSREGPESAATKADDTRRVLRRIYNIILRLLHGGNKKFRVGRTAEQFLEASFSRLLD